MSEAAVSADVSALVRMFEEAEQSTREARQLAERDNDYFHNHQLTDTEKSTLDGRGQPPVIYNRIQRKIDFLSGLERQQRKDPKAFPRTPKDEDAADAATDAIRFVCEDEEWDNIRSAAWDDLLIYGTGIVMVGVKKGRSGYDPELAHVTWDRFFHDPASARADFKDARYMGVVTWYDEDVADEKGWPKDVIATTIAAAKNTETYDDKPKDHMWGDATRKRFRAIELYHREGGKWMRCVFTYGGYLEPKAPSPYMDEEGQPENPLKARSLYVDRNNNRYGAVRVMISAQDEINKRRSKGLHLITMRQVRVSPVSGQDPETIRKELAKPDGILTGEKDDFEILPTNDMARGNFEMLQEAKNEIDLLGANAALAGKNENDMSGRAILAQQQGGMVEVARMFDRLRSLSIDVYRAVWNRIRQVWTDERWIRVTDDERNLRFVGLNQQVTVAMLAKEVAEGDQAAMQKAAEIVGEPLLRAAMTPPPPAPDPADNSVEAEQARFAIEQHQRAQVMLGSFMQQHGQQVIETRNAVNELDVDIVIDEGMDTPSVQAEQFDTLAKMLGTAPPDKQAIIWEALFEVSAIRGKEKIIEKFEQAQQANPIAEKMQQIQVAGAEAEVANTQADTALKQAKTQSEGQQQPTDPLEQQLHGAEVETDRFRAVTERIAATNPAPEQRAA